MEPQQPQGLGYGGPGSTAEVGNRVVSMVSSGPAALRVPGDTLHGRTAKRQSRAGPSQDRTFARSSWQDTSKPRPTSPRSSRTDDSRSSAEYASFMGYSPGIPTWQQDALAFETGTGCGPWTYGADNRPFPWLPWTLFGSNLEHKARNPAACDAIGYQIRPPSLIYAFLRRFLGFFMLCFLISLFHRQLESKGLYCRGAVGRPEPRMDDSFRKPEVDNTLVKLWAETLITTGACFLLAQGLYGVRAARERMERVRQTAVTLAYSFTKTTAATSEMGRNKEEMQLLIYECLALLTAYPVALLEQIRGNTCEPAITRYCQDVARALKQLRSGQDSNLASQCYESKPWARTNRGHHQFATVEYFFEIFSLQLQLEYSRQTMRTKAASLTSQHIIFNLRNHFENLVDLRNVDDRRTPIIRENIDMLSLAGRECGIFSLTDVLPVVFLHSVSVAGWLIALYSPIQRCDWIVDWAPDGSTGINLPTLNAMVPMAVLSLMSSMLTTVLAEMWMMWDPFGKGTNTYGWTLGIAMEIDNMLNDFYEYDTDALVRAHTYMDPVPCRHEMGSDGGESSGDRAQTV
ncbi:hypothetical protein HRG_005131 [Hirsutella rhossiliensis]|uniref:Uncharacterized protein n=1 Tax=Hirsutella rhossiliensis TaxID=111463 RepID=A0A9P8MYI2_9HYPO|nr:uncharacterized protein HRG_05131 [Hirsutella rhossiliensis]KAH0964703.1 hypothetical protein HRG_05131 [Hirsutella rhossiliensis]